MNSSNKKFLVLVFLLVIAGSYLAGNFFLDHPVPVQKQEQKASTEKEPPPSEPENVFKEAPPNLKIPQAFSVAQPNSFADLVKKVQATVVNIATAKALPVRPFDPFGGQFDPFFRGNPYQQNTPKKEQNALGTGFILNEEGDIITNNHVVEGADEIVIKLGDGRTQEVKLVGKDPRLDIAILRPVKPEGPYPSVTLGDSDKLEVGDWVVAIGNPFGLGNTVTAGIVSAKARVLGAGPYDDFIQTDASINPGNSGGPLFDTNGEVVGINSAIIASGQGLGFAIPINMAKEVIPQLIKTGRVSRGWLGVAIREMSAEEATKLGLNKPEGALMAEVIPGGPAAQAGIKAGDIVLEFNGEKVDNAHSLPTLVAKYAPGTKATLVFLQNGSRYERTVTLGSLDNPQSSIGQTAPAGENVMGMMVRDLTVAEKMRVGSGVVVTEVNLGSQASSIGIRPGDLLLQLNNHEIADLQDLKKQVGSLSAGSVIRMALARGPYMYYFAFRKE